MAAEQDDRQHADYVDVAEPYSSIVWVGGTHGGVHRRPASSALSGFAPEERAARIRGKMRDVLSRTSWDSTAAGTDVGA